jgi:hypothetical protein
MEVTEFILVVKEHLLSWQLEISNRDIKLIRYLFFNIKAIGEFI